MTKREKTEAPAKKKSKKKAAPARRRTDEKLCRMVAYYNEAKQRDPTMNVANFDVKNRDKGYPHTTGILHKLKNPKFNPKLGLPFQCRICQMTTEWNLHKKYFMKVGHSEPCGKCGAAAIQLSKRLQNTSNLETKLEDVKGVKHFYWPDDRTMVDPRPIFAQAFQGDDVRLFLALLGMHEFRLFSSETIPVRYLEIESTETNWTKTNRISGAFCPKDWDWPDTQVLGSPGDAMGILAWDTHKEGQKNFAGICGSGLSNEVICFMTDMEREGFKTGVTECRGGPAGGFPLVTCDPEDDPEKLSHATKCDRVQTPIPNVDGKAPSPNLPMLYNSHGKGNCQ